MPRFSLRTLAILKYVPAVLCGLLVVAWVVSRFCRISLGFPNAIFVDSGSIGVFIEENDPQLSLIISTYHPGSGLLGWSGLLGHVGRIHYVGFTEAVIPIPFALTLLLPFSIAPFLRFRFPLWSYFAWTALVAAELTYYLR